jgi:hypothetical protein
MALDGDTAMGGRRAQRAAEVEPAGAARLQTASQARRDLAREDAYERGRILDVARRHRAERHGAERPLARGVAALRARGTAAVALRRLPGRGVAGAAGTPRGGRLSLVAAPPVSRSTIVVLPAGGPIVVVARPASRSTIAAPPPAAAFAALLRAARPRRGAARPARPGARRDGKHAREALVEQQPISLVLDQGRGQGIGETAALDAGRSGRGGGIYSFGDAHRNAAGPQRSDERGETRLHSARRRKRPASTVQDCGINTPSS